MAQRSVASVQGAQLMYQWSVAYRFGSLVVAETFH